MIHYQLLIVLSVYLIALFVVGIFACREVHNEEDYVVAGRKLPLWLAWGTLLATWFGAATMLGAAQAARHEGLRGVILDPFASGFSLIVAGLFFAKPMWEMKLLTISDFYQRKFGPWSEYIASLVIVPGYFGWIGAQFLALADLQKTFFGIPSHWGILIASILILSYTLVGGMWSVTITDTAQLVVALIGLTVLGWTIFAELGGGSAIAGGQRLWRETDPELLNILPEMSLVAGLAWVSTWGSGIFGNIPGQDLMQRIFASNSSRTAVLACVLSGVVYLVFGMLSVSMGLASRILSPEAQETILGALAHQFLSPMMTAVFVVSLVSIIVSTATSAVLAPATIVAHNLLMRRVLSLKGHGLMVERIAVFAMTVAGVGMAFTGQSILNLLEEALAIPLAGLFVAFLMGLYARPRGEASALLSMLFGISAWLGRELLERVFVVQPEEMAQFAWYADYVFAVYSPESAGVVLSYLLWSIAVVPSAILGVVASAVGYWIGHRIDVRWPREEFAVEIAA